jgi:uncharacterized protein
MKWVALVAIPASVVLAACSLGTAARAVRPDAQTARQAVGESCNSNAPTALVVDWPADRRAEFEGALAQGSRGTVLVQYNCPQVRVLTGCSVPAYYSYEPVSLKEEVLRLDDADAVRAKLPTLAAGPLLAKVEAELARGSSLDLGLALVGRLRSEQQTLYRPDVRPECRSATHWVSAVSLGAFAMSVGTRSKVRSAAEIFSSVEGSIASSSTRDFTSRDGDLGACRSVRGVSVARGLPEACRSPVQVELRPIDPRVHARAKCEDLNDVSACVEWASLVYNALGSPRVSLAGGDPNDAPLVAPRVADLCRKGSEGACLGGQMLAEAGVPGISLAEMEEKLCERNHSSSCVMVAQRLEEAGKEVEAFGLFRFGCTVQRYKGDGSVACYHFAARVAAGLGPEPQEGRAQLALDAFAYACVDGWPEACLEVATHQKRGLRPRGNLEGRSRFIKTCDTDGFGCQAAAATHALGLGVPKDLTRARKAWDRSCEVFKKAGSLTCPPFPY